MTGSGVTAQSRVRAASTQAEVVSALDSGEQWPDARVLVIDDDAQNVRVLSRLLHRSGFRHVRATTDDRSAFDEYRSYRPDVVLLDLRMPNVDGFTLLERMRGEEAAPFTPVLVVTTDASVRSQRRALALGANDYVVKPYTIEDLAVRVDSLLRMRMEVRAVRREIEDVRALSTGEAGSEQRVLERLSATCAARDEISAGHPQRVGDLSGSIAAEMRLPIFAVESIRRAAPLHDIGKLAVPDSILLKPGPLTVDEMALMEQHSMIGALLLAGLPFPVTRLAAEVALTHHERWDGAGYPRRLCGSEIPLAGRIVAVADSFDALVHERPYKQAWSVEAALTEIREHSGAQFDPEVVSALLRVVAARGE